MSTLLLGRFAKALCGYIWPWKAFPAQTITLTYVLPTLASSHELLVEWRMQVAPELFRKQLHTNIGFELKWLTQQVKVSNGLVHQLLYESAHSQPCA